MGVRSHKRTFIVSDKRSLSAIDDHSRVAFSQILPDEKQASASDFLEAAVQYYCRLDVNIARVMTDNGSCYRSRAFGKACRRLGIKHIRTKPYTPQTKR